MRQARNEGKYSEGVSDLPGSQIKHLGPPSTLHVNPWSGRKTIIHNLSMDRGMAFATACSRLQAQGGGKADAFYRGKREMYGRYM